MNFLLPKARSSGVEYLLDMQGVGGSKPPAPIFLLTRLLHVEFLDYNLSGHHVFQFHDVYFFEGLQIEDETCERI